MIICVKKDSTVKQVTASFSGEQKSIEIIRSGGEALTDVRPLIDLTSL